MPSTWPLHGRVNATWRILPGNEWELQSLAQAYIAGYRAYGEPDLAPLLGVLDEQVRQAEAAGRDDLVIYMLVLEALARQAMGQMDQAMNLLERALALAATRWLCHDLCMSRGAHGGAAPGGGSAEDFKRVRGSAAGGFQHRHAGCSFLPELDPSQSSLLEPLSKRELEVLRLLASSLTGPQIADELFISLGTFQTHTKSIYGKLGVHNRIEAIERARDLKLV